MQKKIIILISVAALVILIIFGVYFFLNLKTNPAGGGTTPQGLTLFGKKTTPSAAVQTEAPTTEGELIPTEEQKQIAPVKLFQITKVPTAGAIAIQKERPIESLTPAPVIPDINATSTTSIPTIVVKNTETVPALRYVESSTGNIYETFVDKIDEKRISDTTIPNIHDAFFVDNGNAVVLRYLRDDGRTIESFLGQIKKVVLGGDASIELKGSFLPQNIIDLSVSSDLKNFFYLFEFGDGVTGINTFAADQKKVQIFDSPFTEWISAWANSRLITLTTKASYKYAGFLYALDPQSKSFNKVLSNILGLTTLASPGGKSILYSGSDLGLKIFDMDKKTSTDLGLRGLPEKCAWGSGSENVYCAIPSNPSTGKYPDDWYQGSVSFNDVIWKINTKTNAAQMLADPIQAAKVVMDGTRLFLDQKENYLFFFNKKDSTLWGLGLK